MVYDEIIYVLVLFVSIVIGIPLRNLSSYAARQVATGGVGFLVVFGICGYGGLYSLVAFMGNCIIIKMLPRRIGVMSFIWSFLFLLFFRCSTMFGLPPPSPLANAVQLMVTLKLVSVAMETEDFRTKDEKSSFQLGLESEPSVAGMFWYCYSYTGLFTGPFFKYRTYHDYLMTTTHPPWQQEVFTRLQSIGLFGLLYAVAAFYFNIEFVKSDDFYQTSMLYRLLYMVPIFFIGRMRFYSAWLLAECSFITLGMGAYPTSSSPRPGHGPTKDPTTSPEDDGYSYETIRNIDPYKCDFTPTIREGMRNWNMGVQWWLANYIHKRWPTHLKQFRVAAVMGVSAFWHGIEPGFYGAFLSMPLFMLAEDGLVGLKRHLPPAHHPTFEWILWFFKFRSFEYMYMAFALLTLHDTYRYWKSLYFSFHLLAIVIIMTSHLLLPKKIRPKDETKKSN